jgi:acylphosphatase
VHDLTGTTVGTDERDEPGHEAGRRPDADRGSGAGDLVARYVRVRGRVQGVFFRSSMREAARRHAVTGWVRNVEDGSVEAWLEGEPEAVRAVEAWALAGGPPSAEVVAADVRSTAPEGYVSFEVRA